MPTYVQFNLVLAFGIGKQENISTDSEYIWMYVLTALVKAKTSRNLMPKMQNLLDFCVFSRLRGPSWGGAKGRTSFIIWLISNHLGRGQRLMSY